MDQHPDGRPGVLDPSTVVTLAAVDRVRPCVNVRSIAQREEGLIGSSRFVAERDDEPGNGLR
jgi:hypothetical protein